MSEPLNLKLARKLLEVDYFDTLAKQTGLDSNYSWRDKLIYEALAMARDAGYWAGIRIDLAEPEWPAAFIELPTGQVSYHLKQHSEPWDGHTTETKRLRLLEFAAEKLSRE